MASTSSVPPHAALVQVPPHLFDLFQRMAPRPTHRIFGMQEIVMMILENLPEYTPFDDGAAWPASFVDPWAPAGRRRRRREAYQLVCRSFRHAGTRLNASTNRSKRASIGSCVAHTAKRLDVLITNDIPVPTLIVGERPESHTAYHCSTPRGHTKYYNYRVTAFESEGLQHRNLCVFDVITVDHKEIQHILVLLQSTLRNLAVEFSQVVEKGLDGLVFKRLRTLSITTSIYDSDGMLIDMHEWLGTEPGVLKCLSVFVHSQGPSYMEPKGTQQIAGNALFWREQGFDHLEESVEKILVVLDEDDVGHGGDFTWETFLNLSTQERGRIWIEVGNWSAEARRYLVSDYPVEYCPELRPHFYDAHDEYVDDDDEGAQMSPAEVDFHGDLFPHKVQEWRVRMAHRNDPISDEDGGGATRSPSAGPATTVPAILGTTAATIMPPAYITSWDTYHEHEFVPIP